MAAPGWDIPFLQPPSSKARNPPPSTSLGLPPEGVMNPTNHHHTTIKPLKRFSTDRLSSRLLQCKEMPINIWSYFHNAKYLREMTSRESLNSLIPEVSNGALRNAFGGDNLEVNYL